MATPSQSLSGEEHRLPELLLGMSSLKEGKFEC